MTERTPETRPDRPRRRTGRTDPTIAVASPFADEVDVRTSPTWLERLRGLAGLVGLVLASGIALAVAVAAVLLLLAIAVATTFN